MIATLSGLFGMDIFARPLYILFICRLVCLLHFQRPDYYSSRLANVTFSNEKTVKPPQLRLLSL